MEEEASLAIILRARDEASSVLKESEGTLLGIGKAAVGIGLVGAGAIAATGIAAVKMAADFQEATTAIVTGAGEDEKALDDVRQGLLKMAREVGSSPKDLADGLYFIESAGFHAANGGLEVLRIAAIGARVGMTDTKTVADALTSALNAYHLPASQAAHVTDILLTTVAQGKMHMADLAANIGKVMPIASTAGVSLGELGAAIATMTMQGTDASQATTALRFLITNLEAPSKAAATEMAHIGLKAGDLAKVLKNEGLQAALADITEHIGKKFPAGSSEYTAALDKIVGGTRGMTAALELTGPNMGAFKENIAAMSKASEGAGKTMNGWKVVQEDFNFQIDRLKSGLQAALIQEGSKALLILTKLAEAAADNLPRWIAMGEAIGDKAAKAMTVIAGDIQAVGDTLKSVGTELEKHKGRYEILAGFIAAFVTPTLIAMGVAFLVNIVTGITAATTAMIANTAATIADAYWKNVINAYLIFYYVRLGLVTAATAVWTGVQAAHNTVMALFALIQERGVLGTLSYLAVTGAVRVATMAWTAVQWLLNAALSLNPLGIVIIAIAALVAGIIYAYQHSEQFRNIVNGLWDAIRSGADVIWNTIKPPLDWMWGALQNIGGAVGGLISNLSGLSNVQLPNLHIPGFAGGAVVRSGGGGIVARIGEGDEDEVVATMSQIMAAGAAARGGGDGGTYVIQLHLDGKQVSQVVAKHMGRQFTLQGGRMGSGAG